MLNERVGVMSNRLWAQTQGFNEMRNSLVVLSGHVTVLADRINQVALMNVALVHGADNPIVIEDDDDDVTVVAAPQAVNEEDVDPVPPYVEYVPPPLYDE